MDPKGEKDEITVGVFLGFKTHYPDEPPLWAMEKIFNIDNKEGRILDKEARIIEEAEVSVQGAWLESTKRHCRF